MGIFPCRVRFPVVTVVWVVRRFRLKAPPGISSSYMSPLTSSGQRSRASWASQPQKSATLSPQPGGKPRNFIRTCGGIGRKRKLPFVLYGCETSSFTLREERRLKVSANRVWRRICSTMGERRIQGFVWETWGKEITWKAQALMGG